MAYAAKSLKHVFLVARTLGNKPEGADFQTIEESCGFTYHQTERVLNALIVAGVVDKRPSRDGDKGRPRLVYVIVDEDSGKNDGEDSGKKEIGKNPSSSCINNTQEIQENKKTRARRVFSKKNTENTENTVGSGSISRAENEYFTEERVSIDAAVESARVNDAEGRAIRRRLAEVVWERSLRADLLDRAVAAIKLGHASLNELLAAARKAASIASNGVKAIWQTFTLDVKRAFDSVGIQWTPTRPGSEPAPNRFVSLRLNADDEEDCAPRVFTRNGRTFVAV